MRDETVAIIDFETTGLNPAWGDRPTEVAVVLVCAGRIVDRYQSLMNPGRHIPAEVTQLTGITNAMVERAAPVATVMREAVRFVGRSPVVAHNAAFDRKFWGTELERLSLPSGGEFACTLLLARRLYPHSPNHRLGTLVDFLSLPRAGQAHRALADAEMTAHLWWRIGRDIERQYGVRHPCHALLTQIQRTPRARVAQFLAGAC